MAVSIYSHLHTLWTLGIVLRRKLGGAEHTPLVSLQLLPKVELVWLDCRRNSSIQLQCVWYFILDCWVFPISFKKRLMRDTEQGWSSGGGEALQMAHCWGDHNTCEMCLSSPGRKGLSHDRSALALLTFRDLTRLSYLLPICVIFLKRLWRKSFHWHSLKGKLADFSCIFIVIERDFWWDFTTPADLSQVSQGNDLILYSSNRENF